MYYPYSKQSINLDDEKNVLKALRGKFITQGPLNIEFENQLSSDLNLQFAQ